MHVHISRHRNHGYVPADDCLCFALIYLCMIVCMLCVILCVLIVCFRESAEVAVERRCQKVKLR